MSSNSEKHFRDNCMKQAHTIFTILNCINSRTSLLKSVAIHATHKKTHAITKNICNLNSILPNRYQESLQQNVDVRTTNDKCVPTCKNNISNKRKTNHWPHTINHGGITSLRASSPPCACLSCFIYKAGRKHVSREPLSHRRWWFHARQSRLWLTGVLPKPYWWPRTCCPSLSSFRVW